MKKIIFALLLAILAIGAPSKLLAQTNGITNGAYDPTACGSGSVPTWCSGSDIGAWVNAAQLAAQGGGSGNPSKLIYLAFSAGETLAQTTPIALSWNTTLDCRGDTLTFGGSSGASGTAITVSAPFSTTTQNEARPVVLNCTLIGPSGTDTNTNTGIFFGDRGPTATGGAPFVTVRDVFIQSFNTAISFGANAFGLGFDHVALKNNFNAFYEQPASAFSVNPNYGESYRIFNSVINNNDGCGIVGNNLQIEMRSSLSSWDYNKLGAACNGTTGSLWFTSDQDHFEQDETDANSFISMGTGRLLFISTNDEFAVTQKTTATAMAGIVTDDHTTSAVTFRDPIIELARPLNYYDFTGASATALNFCFSGIGTNIGSYTTTMPHLSDAATKNCVGPT